MPRFSARLMCRRFVARVRSSDRVVCIIRSYVGRKEDVHERQSTAYASPPSGSHGFTGEAKNNPAPSLLQRNSHAEDGGGQDEARMRTGRNGVHQRDPYGPETGRDGLNRDNETRGRNAAVFLPDMTGAHRSSHV